MVLHMHHKVPAITIRDIREDEVEGRFLQQYRQGVQEYLKVPAISDVANKLVRYMETVANIYIPSQHDLANLAAPASIEAATRVIIGRLLPIIKEWKEYLLTLDTENIRNQFGDKSANMYNAAMTGLAPQRHVNGPNQGLALKLVMNNAVGLGGGDGGRKRLNGGPIGGQPKLKPGQCRKCRQMVGIGNFQAHNPICPKK